MPKYKVLWCGIENRFAHLQDYTSAGTLNKVLGVLVLVCHTRYCYVCMHISRLLVVHKMYSGASSIVLSTLVGVLV